MAWTATVNLDADKPDVGMATLIWNEGQADEFRCGRRCKVNEAQGAVFVAEAKAALQYAQEQAQRESNLVAWLQNEADK